MKYQWKALTLKDGKICSEYDGSRWDIGKERKVDKPKKTCIGLNCSPRIYDAMQYVSMEVLAQVECKVAKRTDRRK